MAVTEDALVGGGQQDGRDEAAVAAGLGERRRRLVLGHTRSHPLAGLGEGRGELGADRA